MKTTKIEKIQKEKEIVTSVTCNRCGVSEEGEVFDSDIQEQKFEFGYGSNKDGDLWKFHLCDECTENIIKGWMYKPEIIEFI